MVGTNSKTLSLLHVAEVLAGVSYADVFCYDYLGWNGRGLVEKDDGSMVEVELSEVPGCSEGFGKFDDLLAESGIMRCGKIYISKVMLFKASEALELAVNKLKEDPFWLLCPKGNCRECDFRRKAVS